MSQWQQERRGNVGMMGQQASNQQRLFYSFNLEEHVPADLLLRGIDRFLDLSALRRREEVHLNLAYRWFCRLGWKTRCPITLRSPRTGTGASVRAALSAICSRQSF